MSSPVLKVMQCRLDETTIFITRFVDRSWIFYKGFVNSSYFSGWRRTKFTSSLHNFPKLPSHLISPNFRQTTINISRSFLCKIADSHYANTIVCCYPFMFLWAFTHREQTGRTGWATAAAGCSVPLVAWCSGVWGWGRLAAQLLWHPCQGWVSFRQWERFSGGKPLTEFYLCHVAHQRTIAPLPKQSLTNTTGLS